MDQSVQNALQNAAATQAALTTLTWALGIAFTVCFGVVIAGVKALYSLKSDVSVLLKLQKDQKSEYDFQRKEVKELGEKVSKLRSDFSGFKGSFGGRNGFSRGTT